MGERRRTTRTFEIQSVTGSHEVLDRLFVYGTLRQGQTARSLVANQVTRTARASMSGAMYAFPMGYPGLVEGGSARVIGEIVWLTELAATFGLLDAYEGQEFVRVIKKVTLDESGEQVWAWVYTLADPAAVRYGTLIEHGDWVRYWTEQG
jgi:gamma-glutamylcyclotransferase (GGCT)/AIG2-like uncharacterized protein YtfP